MRIVATGKICNMKINEKKEHMYELFSTIEIINNSEQFIGTKTSNIGIYMLMRNSAICNMIDDM